MIPDIASIVTNPPVLPSNIGITYPTWEMALHISHVGYVMQMFDGRTGGFVAILAISGITLTVRACHHLCIVS